MTRTRKPLTIAVAQPVCAPRDVAANARIHAEVVRSARSRVVIFPELSLTGYELDAPPMTADDVRLRPLFDACADAHSVALVGAPVVGSTDRPHIGMLAVTSRGITVAYRKMWLGGAEAEHFAPGKVPGVLEVDGWRLGLAICKDTGVPEHASLTAELGMDAYVAAVLEAADDAGTLEPRARRTIAAHRVWVAVASFAGSTGGGYTQSAGGSAIWDPDARRIVAAGQEPGAVARAVLTERREAGQPPGDGLVQQGVARTRTGAP